MRIPKRYGQSRIDRCPFCDGQATAVNRQGVPVCRKHKDAVMNDLKCVCGGPLDIMNGKYGVFFNCIRCGNMNLRKVLEINEVRDINERQAEKSVKKGPKEITVRSDDPLYFD